MDIQTKFGICKNIKVKPYNEEHNTFTLGFISGNYETEYDILGFDAPTNDDPVWRYWVESGDADGASETNNAELNESDKLVIQNLYKQYSNKT